MDERRDAYSFLMAKPEGKRPLEDPDLDGKIILKCMFKKWGYEAWIGLIWLRIWTGYRHL
jgi:hypothetical protein